MARGPPDGPTARPSAVPSGGGPSPKRRRKPAAGAGEKSAAAELLTPAALGQLAALDREDAGQVVMATVVLGRRLGVAYCRLDTAEVFIADLYLSRDPETSAGSDAFVWRLFRSLDLVPHAVFACAASAAIFQRAGEGDSPEAWRAVRDLPAVLGLAAHASSNANVNAQLARVWVRGMPEDVPAHERMWRIKGMVDFEYYAQIKALGALLSVVATLYTGSLRWHAVGGDPLLALEYLGYAETDVVRLSAHTVAALQIFKDDAHPSVMGLGKQAKEGNSLFNLFAQRCATPQGEATLREWFLAPARRPEVIADRHAAVGFFLGLPTDQKERVRWLLGGAKDLGAAVEKVQAVQGNGTIRASVEQMRVIAQTVEFLCKLRDALTGLVGANVGADPAAARPGGGAAQFGFFARIDAVYDQRLLNLYQLITTVLDFSAVDRGAGDGFDFHINMGLCAPLDELRETYLRLPDHLTHVIAAELARIPKSLTREHMSSVFSLQYLPQLGYLVKTATQLQADLKEVLPDYRLAFHDESLGSPVYYYECEATRVLNEQVGDLRFKIQDQEAAFVRALVGHVESVKGLLVRAGKSVGPLDALLAMAAVAGDGGYVQPTLTAEDNSLKIVKGRHPLLELALSDGAAAHGFVPNSTTAPHDEGRIQIITGPNGAGKSVYLKQVGLIVFLCHVGSFVPAEACEFSVVDAIYTKIYSTDSATDPESTFLSEALQVCRMLHNYTSNSLALIDEFGKGTLASDGVGLFVAIAQELCEESALPPKFFACTHFTEVCNERYFTAASHQLRFQQMAVHVAEVGDRPDDLTFLYQVVDGVGGQSFALACAKVANVDPATLERAAAVMEAYEDPRREISTLNADPHQRQMEIEILELMERLRKADTACNDPLQQIIHVTAHG